MNKKSGDPYLETVGAEIVYCHSEDAWVFRHHHISKVDISSGDEVSLLCFIISQLLINGVLSPTTSYMKEECLQWLLRSPESKVYDLIDVPHDDWSVWTGVSATSSCCAFE